MLHRLAAAAAIAVFAGLMPLPSFADTTTPSIPAQPAQSSEDIRRAEVEAAFAAAITGATKGPANVPFLAQATLKLPEGFLFVPVKESNRLMRAYGNSAGGDNFVGMIMPDSNEDWFITAYFNDAGYVKDEEAQKWDVDALLKGARDGVEEDNADRVSRGFAKIKVDGWIEKPAYDAKQHRLVYSMSLSDLDAKESDERSINYHTYALGREGYFSLDLVTGSRSIEMFKARANTVLSGLDYKSGKRYEEFVASTDRIAEYGIAALVAGVAAKKLGLLALVGLALAKFGKVILVAVVAFGAVAMRLFRGLFGSSGKKE